jgi:bacterioferritin
MQRLGTVMVGETPAEKFEAALELEKAAIERLNRGIALCVERGDNGTRELLARILEGEEEHADWLETQLALIERLGAELYLSQQIHG